MTEIGSDYRRFVVVISGPSGAGKSTVVPLALLEAGWLGADRIMMLEPRRVVVRPGQHDLHPRAAVAFYPSRRVLAMFA